jgi:hypothetical protein
MATLTDRIRAEVREGRCTFCGKPLEGVWERRVGVCDGCSYDRRTWEER